MDWVPGGVHIKLTTGLVKKSGIEITWNRGTGLAQDGQRGAYTAEAESQ